MYNLYFLKYNSYFNRRIKVGKTEQELINLSEFFLSNINFNVNDYIKTELVLNRGVLEDIDIDYILAYNLMNSVYSHWFIVKKEFNRRGQFILYLKRDILYDFRNDLLNSKLYISRKKLNENDYNIYNKEGFTFNQIKTKELEIPDNSYTPWIVGYYDIKGISSLASGRTITPKNQYDISMYTISHTDWEYYNKSGLKSATFESLSNFSCSPKALGTLLNLYVGTIKKESFEYTTTNMQTNTAVVRSLINSMNENDIKNGNILLSTDNINSYLSNNYASDITNKIDIYNNKKVLFSDGVYKISFIDGLFGSYSTTLTEEMWNELYKDFEKSGLNGTSNWNTYYTKEISYYGESYQVLMEKISSDTIYYEIPSTANKNNSNTYKMFCMPYKNINIKTPFQTSNVSMKQENVFEIINDIVEQTTISNLYDIQLLPYCPLGEEYFNYSQLSQNEYLLTMKDSSNMKNFNYSCIRKNNSSGDIIGIMFFPTNINRTFKYNLSIKRITNIKVQNETEFLRFNDTTHNSSWDFDYVQNGGLSKVNVFCTFKPYNPFILIQPKFDKLYGENYKDSRGLICSGDYSLDRVSDAWITYKLNNKNYQNIFDRQIENLSVSNKITNQNSIFSTIANSLSASVGGAIGGSFVGGIGGAVSGAVVGGTASTIGGLLDYSNQIKLQEEQISYSTDIYNYNLQNIQAQPTTLSKVSGLNIQTREFPYIELYSASNNEISFFTNWLEYNGMKTDELGYLSEDYRGYIKANILKCDLPNDIIYAMNEELKNGVIIED